MRPCDQNILARELREQLKARRGSGILVDVENRGDLGVLQLDALCMDDVACAKRGAGIVGCRSYLPIDGTRSINATDYSRDQSLISDFAPICFGGWSAAFFSQSGHLSRRSVLG